MKRIIVLATLLTVGALSLAVAASQQPAAGAAQAAPKVVEVEKLRDNLFVLTGGGGNTVSSSARLAWWSWIRRTPGGASRSSTVSRT